jgi:hypothetical protein
MTNPRHKERHYGRNSRDLIDMALKTMDKVEAGKGFFEALGEAFVDVKDKRVQEETQHPVGPGIPIGFRSPAERVRQQQQRSEDAPAVTVTATYQKDGIPYCAAHDIPLNICTMCRDRAKGQS